MYLRHPVLSRNAMHLERKSGNSNICSCVYIRILRLLIVYMHVSVHKRVPTFFIICMHLSILESSHPGHDVYAFVYTSEFPLFLLYVCTCAYLRIPTLVIIYMHLCVYTSSHCLYYLSSFVHT